MFYNNCIFTFLLLMLFYRIQAIQLEYTESFQRLMLASRKAPQDTADGFNVLIHKLSILG